MSSRFVRPETLKIDISNGDWLLVKRRLTAGEARAIYQRAYVDGVMTPTLLRVSTVQAYLIDWSLVGLDGNQMSIRGLSLPDLKAVLDNLDQNDFREISDAIEAHDAAMEKERAAAKNSQASETDEPVISPSPAIATGALIGSAT